MAYGPVDLIALEFDGSKLRGEILPALRDLVKDKVVRVIDLVIIRKYDDGAYEALELQQVDSELMELFDPLEVTVSGIVQEEDIEAIAASMESNAVAAVLLFENLWAVTFKEAVQRAEGRLIAQERIPFDALEEVLAIFAENEQATSDPMN